MLAARVADRSALEGSETITVVGTGRCGSTLLHRLLARHDDLGWLSTFNEVFPAQPWLSVFSGLYRWPLPFRLKHAKAFPKPFECYRFWEHFLPGFMRRDRPPTADDVPEEGIEPLRRITRSILGFQRKPCLLFKVTGWSRIAYFDRIYPHGHFISLRRDPRAVVSSWMKAGWLDVVSPPDRPEWQWGEVPEPYYQAWRDLGGGPFLTAALKIRLDLEDVARNAELVPDRFHELWYEDLISRPVDALRGICDFAGLEWTPRFERVVAGRGFHDFTGKWRQHLSDEQGEVVLEFLRRTDEVAVGVPGGLVAAATR
jgi:omega-hydroxy-beta-dihydromenaquinone-9 sulfotransferase